jgi:hypothetical protein
MFLRIFTYRVQPQLRDRHLAIQQRAAKLYKKHLDRSPRYYRRAGDPNVWVELHEYPDRATCKHIADAIAKDKDLAGLWGEFQGTFDPAYPVRLDEYDEYEIPSPPNMAPIAQPPIDATSAPASAPATQPVEVKPIDTAGRDLRDATPPRRTPLETPGGERVDPRGTLRPATTTHPEPPVLPDDVLEVADEDATHFSDRG